MGRSEILHSAVQCSAEEGGDAHRASTQTEHGGMT